MTDEAADTTQESLPFGYLSLDGDGTIKQYNPFGPDDATMAESDVLGKSFFQEVFGSPEIERLETKFKEFVLGNEAGSLSANINIKRGQRSRRIHIGFVRSPLKDEVIVTVNPVGHEDLPLSAQIRPDPLHGTLLDSTGKAVVIANEDFWQGFEAILAVVGDDPQRGVLHQLGKEWGLAHALRVESFVQRESSHTLGELQIQIALEYLSGSLAVLGLGTFEVDFGFRQRGIVVINHRSSPFPTIAASDSGGSCAILAGFHAGLLTYLSGRALWGLELFCAHGSEDHCRFLIGTEDRLAALRGPELHPTDQQLIEELRTLTARKGPGR